MPWPALLMALFMISLTGIPPTAGFWGKFYLFTAVVDADLTWLAIVAVVMSSVSAYYYLRVVWYMYFREAAEGVEVEAEPADLRSSGVGTAVEPGGARRAGRGPVPRAAAARRRGRRAAHRRRLSRALRRAGAASSARDVVAGTLHAMKHPLRRRRVRPAGAGRPPAAGCPATATSAASTS